MEFVRRVSALPPAGRGCVLTIGNFDGVHRGHQAIIQRLTALAATHDLPATLLTFDPTPLEFFKPEAAPARLSSLREKIQDTARYGLHRLVRARFDERFAAQLPTEFVRSLLVGQLGVAAVMVGADFRFGRDRAGDLAMLEKLGRECDFEVLRVPTVSVDGQRVSSTRVREALAAGQPDVAETLLGRPYRVCGRVIRGQRLGRSLGVPTANLDLQRKVAPCHGVYAVRVRLADGRMVDGAASLGTRPTVNGQGCLLEVHLLDFNEDLYGTRIEVFFHAFLRGEARFDSTSALRDAMMADIDHARALLARARPARDEPNPDTNRGTHV